MDIEDKRMIKDKIQTNHACESSPTDVNPTESLPKVNIPHAGGSFTKERISR